MAEGIQDSRPHRRLRALSAPAAPRPGSIVITLWSGLQKIDSIEVPAEHLAIAKHAFDLSVASASAAVKGVHS